MANDQHELRSINWSEVFSFTHIFKSFQMAIHPSKLLLALAAILVIYLGGRIMDGVWLVARQSGMPGEVDKFISSSRDDFDSAKSAWLDGRDEAAAQLAAETSREARDLAAFTQKLPFGPFGDAFREKLSASNREWQGGEPKSASAYLEEGNRSWKPILSKAKENFKVEVDRIEELLKANRKAPQAVPGLSEQDQKNRRQQWDTDYCHALQTLTARKQAFCEQAQAVSGKGVFALLLVHEVKCINSAVTAIWVGNISGGLALADSEKGFIHWSLTAVRGIVWLIREHYVFAVILLLISLAAWALFGGAIYRIAAMHAAREEKISMSQALRFAAGKFFSFFTAPLLPLAIIFMLGLLLAVGGLLGNLGGFGAILVGALFFVSIALGLLISFLLIGLFCGVGLMYPTIAVEGSDSFDAISRSFSYVFARPWRSLLYGLVALVHGVLCYLFVRVFAFLALFATHYFVNWGVWTGGTRLSDSASRLDVIWQVPTLMDLHGQFNWAAMTGAEKAGAVLLAFWVYMVVAMCGAFLLSYLASSTTMIYYLLRRKVDATDLDDVYIEEGSEQQPPAATETPAASEGPKDQPAS